MRWGILCGVIAVFVALMCAAAPAMAAEPPANDDFANAQVLASEVPVEAVGNNFHATKESHEPNPAGTEPAGHSVWYRWQAPRTEGVSIAACGEETQIALGVYTGEI